MKKSKFSETQIVTILKQGDVGVPIKDLCRQAGISTATYYQWKSKYGGMEASDLRRVKELEAENAKLKRMYAEQALDIAAMKELTAKILAKNGVRFTFLKARMSRLFAGPRNGTSRRSHEGFCVSTSALAAGIVAVALHRR